MRSTMRIITIALLTTLATLAPVHDAQGRVTPASPLSGKPDIEPTWPQDRV